MNSKHIYAFEVKPSEKDATAVLRSTQCPHNKKIAVYYPEVETLYDVFMRGRRLNPDGPCYGYRPKNSEGKAGNFKWFSYNETWEMIQDFGSGLLHLDLVPRVDDYRIMGVYAHNCMEWVLTEQSCNAYTMTLCPIYDTLGADSVEYILRQTCMKTCVCTANESLKIMALLNKTPDLKVIIQIGDIDENVRRVAEENHITLYSFSEIMSIGKENRVTNNPPSPQDVCTICYTSGTTGLPKGALITHRNFMASLCGCLYTGISPTTEDSYLSYLPLAHVLERIMNLAMLIGGARIGFYQGDTRRILDDIRTLRPSVFCSVPRLLNKIYDALNESIKNMYFPVRYLFNRGVEAKVYNMAHGGTNYHWFYDPVLFSTIRSKTGLDRVRVTISGSAPLSQEVLSFLRCILNGVIIEGYGATETSGPCTLQVGDDFDVGNVGGPLPCCDFKLRDVPEMGYLTTDRDHNGILCKGRGELLVRGYNMTIGYFKAPELTSKSFDSEGFFATGDIAIILPNYSVKIVDRKKNFFKLAQGEYVAAEKLEIIYGQSPLISQIFIHGDSYQSYLVAVIVPEKDYVMKWAAKIPELKESNYESVCESKQLESVVRDDLMRLFKDNKLRGFERINKFKIDCKTWSVENGLLTPTFKLLRKQIQMHYSNEIQQMYSV